MEKILNNVMFKSEAMQQILREIGPYIESAATILLYGESGSGMGFLAQAIHHASGRPGKFLSIPGFALEKETIKQQFLGIDDRPGWLEETDKGTIFVKRLSEMSLDIQEQLAAIMGNRSVDGRLLFPRIGRTEMIEVNNRFIFSMTHDFNIAVQDELTNRRFFEEMQRRGGKIVRVPALRERKNDMIEIANHLIANFAKKYGASTVGLSDSAKNVLLNYNWPGNIEELKQVLETIIAKERELATISHEQLPDNIIHPEVKGENNYRLKLKDDAKFIATVISASLNVQTEQKKLRLDAKELQEIRRVEDTSFAPPKFKYFLLRLKDGSQISGKILDKKLLLQTSFDPAYEIDPQNIVSMYVV